MYINKNSYHFFVCILLDKIHYGMETNDIYTIESTESKGT